MFDINGNRINKFTLIEIIKNYHSLIYDEIDVLFYGQNYYDTYIIGSIIEESYDEDCYYYFYLPINNNDFFEFLNGKISYLSLFKNNIAIYIVKKDYLLNIIDAYEISKSDIPNEYLPLEDSFYISSHNKESKSLIVKLGGSDADYHQTSAVNLNYHNNLIIEMNKNYKNFFSLNKDIEPFIQLKTGSFEINYSIKRTINNNLSLFDNYGYDFNKIFWDIFEFISINIINYNGSDYFESNKFKVLSNDCFQLFSVKNNVSYDEFLSVFKEFIYQNYLEVYNLSTYNKKDFTNKSFFLKSNNYESNINNEPIFWIDDSNKNKIKSINEEIEKSLSKNVKLFEDEKQKKYQILIYNLNTETKKGSALLVNAENKLRPRINFSIKIAESIISSKFTQSLDQSEEIEIEGLMKWKIENTKIKYLYLTILD